MVIGIDAGSTTGVAVLHNGKLCLCYQVKKAIAIARIADTIKSYGIKKAYVEKPRYAVLYDRPWLRNASKVPFHSFGSGKGGISIADYKSLVESAGARANNLTAGQIKLAQNVGQNIEFTNEIIRHIKLLGLDVIEIAPRKACSKWAVNFWCRVFEWKETRVAGEHARDAACIAYLNG